MVYKFHQYYALLKEECPTKDYMPKEISKAYRWVFENINDDRNFISQFEKSPKRFLNKEDAIKCNALALSMFNNMQGAKLRYEELKDDICERVHYTLGNHIAEGKLLECDGVVGNIERFGHFNFHPSIKINFEEVFKIIDNIL